MHVYAWPVQTGDLIQYGDPGTGATFRVGSFYYIADTSGDQTNGHHDLGHVVDFPGYCSRDAMIALVRAAIKTAANSTYSVTLTDDQVTVLGL